MACSWSLDGKALVTSSLDCTVKLCMLLVVSRNHAVQLLTDDLGDVEARTAVTTWTLGAGVNHQQVGNVWSGTEDIVSLSCSGDLNIFDRRSGSKPIKVINVSLVSASLSL